MGSHVFADLVISTYFKRVLSVCSLCGLGSWDKHLPCQPDIRATLGRELVGKEMAKFIQPSKKPGHVFFL